ncbi:MAG: hypothetical protein V3R87_04500 [Dehalococcoidia bacterium]
MKIQIGQIVHYHMSQADADQVLANRRNAGSAGNRPRGGDVLPFMIVVVYDEHCVNGRVVLDGTDILWMTSCTEGDGPGQWFLPPYSPELQDYGSPEPIDYGISEITDDSTPEIMGTS